MSQAIELIEDVILVEDTSLCEAPVPMEACFGICLIAEKRARACIPVYFE